MPRPTLSNPYPYFVRSTECQIKNISYYLGDSWLQLQVIQSCLAVSTRVDHTAGPLCRKCILSYSDISFAPLLKFCLCPRMGVPKQTHDEETEPLTRQSADFSDSSSIGDSSSSASISLALLDRLNRSPQDKYASRSLLVEDRRDQQDEERDLNDGSYLPPGGKPLQKNIRIICWGVGLL